ncbi:hypothetical protein ACMX25_30930 [Caballeronia sp. 15715]|uniref:hypothetical protein n=1 Tax=Caballeronia sp. 15715 TaxID=3391030 RepID=UPI0039E38F9D
MNIYMQRRATNGEQTVTYINQAMNRKSSREELGDENAYRKLFLRGYRAPCLPAGVSINVDLLVDLRASDSSRDELEDVIDYNIMRDALISVGPQLTVDGATKAAEALVAIPGVQAAVVAICDANGQVSTSRRRARESASAHASHPTHHRGHPRDTTESS